MVPRWAPSPTLRPQIGLEDVGDLQNDLAREFEAMRAAGR
jgi:cystathionine beta-lyase/cystathionine gamma-synthase